MQKTKMELPKKYRIGIFATINDSGKHDELCGVLAKIIAKFVNDDETVSEEDIDESLKTGKRVFVSKPLIHSVAELKSLALMSLFNEMRLPMESFIEKEE